MVGLAPLVLVAHVSALHGRASLARSEGNAVPATVNEPLLPGDTFATHAGAAAEIALDASVAVRVDGNSRVQLVSLARHHRYVRLLDGTIDVSAHRNGDAPRIETSAGAVAPDSPGSFRISAAGGETSVTAERGTIRILTPNGMQILRPGEVVTIGGTPDAPALHYGTPAPPDDFDRFNLERDAVPAENAYLSRYGTWTTLPRYGEVWRPSERSEWTPFLNGRWFWRNALGWTWISRESWGWTPYHYGAWTYDAHDGWCWVPPSGSASTIAWASGNGALFTILNGSRMTKIGWLPLAPNEPSHPRLSQYANAQAPNAVVTLDFGDFYSGNVSRAREETVKALPATLRIGTPQPPKGYHSEPSARSM